MKKIFTSILMVVLCASSLFAQDMTANLPGAQAVENGTPAKFEKKALKPALATNFVAKSDINRAAATNVSLKYVPAAYYTASGSLANYYFCLTSVPSTYDANTGSITLESAGWSVALDLYGDPSSPMAVPTGTYTKGDATTTMTWNPEYSSAAMIKADGTVAQGTIGDKIVVTKDALGNTIIKVSVTLDGDDYNMTYTGSITFTDTNVGSGHTLPQIGRDIITDFTGSYGSYRGNLFESNTGNMVINLYDCEFNSTTGSHTGVGYCVQLCLFNRLFAKPNEAVVEPGLYTVARNFAKGTYYPGTELTYMGNTLIIGCLAQYHDAAGNYSYSCVVSGTVNIVDAGDGNFTITVDMMTDLGHVVKGSYTGKVPVTNDSNDQTKVSVSNLTDDVVLNLDQIPTARIYQQAQAEGCSHFVIDIGSPSGKDESLANNGGDAFRIELLVPGDCGTFRPGTYTVMPENWSTYYKPYALYPGHFVDGGDLSGTRYFHFQEGHYLIMDMLAPAAEGNVSIIDNEDDTYTFNIDVNDDAGYNISGSWTGPITYTWDYNGVENISSDFAYYYADKNTIALNGINANTTVAVYGVNGALLSRTVGKNTIDLSNLESGVYVVKVGAKKAFKIVK